MYKSSFLSHLARASKQHPFFTQNINGANSTALALVKPKAGLAADKAYFSSWGSNGHSASNAGGTSITQPILLAINNDDNAAWERELGLHRKQFRSIAGIRRYSTGTQTVTDQNPTAATIQLRAIEGSESPENVAEPPPDSGEGRESPKDVTEHISGGSEQQRLREPTALESRLLRFQASKQLVPLLEDFEKATQAGEELTTEAFNIFFEALMRLSNTLEVEYDIERKKPFFGVVPFLSFYKLMLDRDIIPNTKTYSVVLQFLARHASDLYLQEKILEGYKVVLNTPQEAFVSRNQAALRQAQELDVVALAMQIFRASISVRPVHYSGHLLGCLLNACVVHGRFDDAVDIFDYFDEIGVQKTVNTYTALLNVCAKAGDMAGAVECFNTWKKGCRSMPKHDYFLIYDAMVRCYCASGDGPGGLKFFEAAVEQTRSVSPRSYENMISSLCRAGMFDEAIAFAKERRGDNHTSLSRALGEIVREASIQNRFDLARSVFKEVKSLRAFDEIPSATWTYLASLIQEGQLDDAKALVADCVRDTIELRIALLSSLISKYLAAGRVDDAFETAQFIGQRRAVANVSELNRTKTGLFIDFLIRDMKRLNLLDAKTIPEVVQVLYMLAQNAVTSELIPFLELALAQMTPSDWSSRPGLLDQVCAVAMSNIVRLQRDSSLDTIRVQELLCNLVDVVIKVASEGNLTLSIQTSQQLSLCLREMKLDDAEQKILQARSTTGTTPNSSNLKQMSPSRAVFLPNGNNINGTLSAELSRALESAEPRLAGRSQQDSRIPYSRILVLFERSSQSGPCVQGEVLLKAIGHFGRVGMAEPLEQVLRAAWLSLPKITYSQDLLANAQALVYDTAIIAYNELQDSDSAQKCHDSILDLGFVPSATAYASFIARMDEKKYRDGASRAKMLFQEALDLGVHPNEYLYNTVIAKLAKARRNDDVLSMFEDMKTSNLLPNGVTYGTIINSCCRVGQTAKAEELLAELETLPRHQNRIAPYNTLIQHFVQVKKDRERAFYYWEKLRARAIPPTAHSYRLLIEAHGNIEPVDPVSAEAVIGLMQANRVRVESIHHAAIIHMYGVTLNDLPAAKRYFENCRRRSVTVVDDVLYQSIIEAYVRANDTAGMERLLAEMKKRDVPLNAYIVNLAIRGYGEINQIEPARLLFDQLPSQGAGTRGKEPSTYEALIRAYNDAAQPEKGAEVLQLMRHQRYPDAVVNRAAQLVQAS